MSVKKIAIDLGTANSLVWVPKKEIVLNEPSVVAVSTQENKVLAVGKEARKMIGRTPDAIRVYRPLKEGVIADYRVTQAMLHHFISIALGKFHFLKPELVISVPADITSAERRAVIKAGLSVGAKRVYLAKEPILAAIGAGIPIESCSGHMVIDIGGGTSEVAVISLGGIVASSSARVGGDRMDEAIIHYVKSKYNLALGLQSVEEAKKKIGTALPLKEQKYLEVKGRDLLSGLPRNIKLSSNEIQEAIQDVLEEIVLSVKDVLRRTPAELSADIMNKGIILSGGGGLLQNFDQLITKDVKVPCFVAEDSLLSVIKGGGVVLESLDFYRRSLESDA
jgi:rod shape-determining protein MreB and related proteins